MTVSPTARHDYAVKTSAVLDACLLSTTKSGQPVNIAGAAPPAKKAAAKTVGKPPAASKAPSPPKAVATAASKAASPEVADMKPPPTADAVVEGQADGKADGHAAAVEKPPREL